jgi:hypothetical protein
MNVSDLNLFENREFFIDLGRTLSLFISPILLLLGGLGNPLCILILLRKNYHNPTIVYLCLLAAFDCLVLFTGLLRQYLKDAFQIDIRNYNSFSCKIHVFLTYTFMQISSYILVAVALNRFTIVFNRTICCKQKTISKNTTNSKAKSSLKSVYIIFALICVLVSLMNFHFLIYYDINKKLKQNEHVNDCTILKGQNEKYYYFRAEIYGKLHLYLFIVLPSCILIVVNFLIIKKIMTSNKKSRATAVSSKNRDKRASLSVMLVSVCIWFILLKTPASIYLNFPVQEMNKVYFPFTYNLFMLINYTNHAVNFILYVLTCPSFRQEFDEFFTKSKLYTLITRK